MHYRPDVQILRGIAVVLVVLFHLNIPFFSHGFLGVDSFFVISGFLMALLYQPGQALRFYQRRANRLLPAYFATAIATVIISAFVTLPSEHTQVVDQGLFAAFFLSNIGFWSQNSYFSTSEFTPLLHLWSLGVEIQFYIIVPLLFGALGGGRRIGLALIGIISVIGSLILVTISPKTAFFMMPFRIWQFLAGAGIAWYMTSNGRPSWPRPAIGLTSLVILVAIIIAYPTDGQATNVIFGHPAIAAILVTITTAGVLAFGIPTGLQNSPAGRAMERTGDWSYSIYLAHFPVIALGLYRPFSGTILVPSGALQTVILLIAICIASAIIYGVFDRPRIWPKGFVIIGVASIITAASSFASGNIARMRFNDTDLNILSAFQDRSEYRCGKLMRIVSPTAILCELTTDLPDTAPRLVLVGNSHADAIKETATRVAQRLGYRLFFTVSNSPVVGAPSAARLLDEFRNISADGIILHFSASHAEIVAESGFDRDARNAGFMVRWILPVPTYGSSVQQWVWQSRDRESSPQFLPDNLDAIDNIEAEIQGNGIDFFDTRPILCPDSCLLADSEMRPFYHDSGHLTLTGARQLEGVIEEVIRSFDSSGSITAAHSPLTTATPSSP